MKINIIENGEVVVREMTEDEIEAFSKTDGTVVSRLDEIEEQCLYTARMTNTLIGGEE